MNKDLEGKLVRIDGGGQESRTGKLLTACSDYFTVLTEKEGIVFYQAQHVKRLTQNVNQGAEFESVFEERYQLNAPHNFRSVLSSLKNFWVKVNRGGPKSVEGVLSEVFPNFITVVVKEEVVRIAIFHIRDISYQLNSDRKKRSYSRGSDNGKSESGNKGESRGRSNSGNSGERRGRDRTESDNKEESRYHNRRNDRNRHSGSNREKSGSGRLRW